MKPGFLFIIIFACITPSLVNAQSSSRNYQSQKYVEGKKAAVVTAHPLATKAGMDMLKQGGNAVDAAIAVQFALAVVYPGAGNLGGGGFMVACLKNGKKIALDYREVAPMSSHRDMFLDRNAMPVEGLSLHTHLASGVPGTVAGIFASLPYAKLPLKKLIEPAIELAGKGFAITQRAANEFNKHRDEFIKLNRLPVAFVKNKPWKKGDILVQKDLANTLKRISTHGLKGFYSGKTAELIVAEMKRGNGIISISDLLNYKAVSREVLSFPYKGMEVVGMPLPSSGAIILQQLLRMTEDKGLANYGFHSPEAMQLMIEAERRAYSDRAYYLGDPGFAKVPLKGLLDPSYLRQRMNDVIPGKAGNSDTTKQGIPPESMETTHISIIDAEGNAVSLTTTLNDSYGSKIVVGGAGFILNNQMDDFSIKPGHPNMYGAVGNEANEIAPGKKMLSSMTPTIILKNGKPHIIIGTPGGTTIPTSVYQSIVNLVEFRLSAKDAIHNYKFHHQWLPDVVLYEEGFPKGPLEKIEKMGYKISMTPWGQFSRLELIVVDHEKKKIHAVADWRGDDDARVY